MTLSARESPTRWRRESARDAAGWLRVDAQAAVAWLLGFAPVLCLALRGGGYDPVIYSEAGLVAWWVVLLGALTGVLPRQRIGRLGWLSVALLGGFVLWTGVAAAWSASAERTVAELGRVAAYLGLFVLGLFVVRRETVRQLVTGIGVAFGVLCALAVLSRLYPSLFPVDQVAEFFPGSQARLSYPLNYANGTGEFLAIGLPLLLMIATRARTLAGQAAAAAALPVAAIGVVLTASRGGVLTAVVAIVVFYALTRDRLPKLATGLAAAAGSAVVIAGLLDRPAVYDALSGPAAVAERHQLALLLAGVCLAVALVQVAIGVAVRHPRRPRALQISRRGAGWLTATGVAAALAVAIAAGAPGKVAHQWQVFKQTDVTGVVSPNVYARLGTAAGSHRYQYWRAAVQAFESKPLTGIGPGTFQFYWAQHGSLYEFILNAHSLYLETLAETGVVGGAVIAAFLLVLLGAGVVRAVRAPPGARTVLAAATAALAAFGAAAAYDWVWQLPVMPLVALLLGAAIVAHRGADQASQVRSGRRSWTVRGLVATSAGCAIIAIAIPFGETVAIRASQADVSKGRLSAALSAAATAQRLEPYAATPRLQRALVLERAGDLDGARAAIVQATARAPTDWSIWLIRARIDAESGRERGAVSDYRRAHALNPLSPTTALGG
jgi:hypothetical protein